MKRELVPIFLGAGLGAVAGGKNWGKGALVGASLAILRAQILRGAPGLCPWRAPPEPPAAGYGIALPADAYGSVANVFRNAYCMVRTSAVGKAYATAYIASATLSGAALGWAAGTLSMGATTIGSKGYAARRNSFTAAGAFAGVTLGGLAAWKSANSC